MQPVCKMNWLYLLHIRMTEMREEQLLQAAGIKPTAARILIIRNLDAADHPLSMAEIGDALETVDKSVISRTLALFRTARLIHIIQDGSDSVRYELCRCHCSVTGGDTGDDSDRHIHFIARRAARRSVSETCQFPNRHFRTVSLPVPSIM